MTREELHTSFLDHLKSKYPLKKIHIGLIVKEDAGGFSFPNGMAQALVQMQGDIAFMAVAGKYASDFELLQSIAHEYKHMLQRYKEKTFPLGLQYPPMNHPCEVEARAFGAKEATRFLDSMKKAA